LESGRLIEEHHRVGEVLDLHPQLLHVFVAFGFTPLQNRLTRKLLAGQVTIGQACRMLGVAQAKFLTALNEHAFPQSNARLALPVLKSQQPVQSSWQPAQNECGHSLINTN
jgi:hypothetical protein